MSSPSCEKSTQPRLSTVDGANTGTTPEPKVALLGGVGGKKIKNRVQPQLNDPTMVGIRTGITLPPRGQIPLDEDGLEDPDAFFAAAKWPAPGGSLHNSPTSPGGMNSHGGSPNNAYGKRAEKAREREKREEDKRRRRDELEEEGRKNIGKKPDILNKNAASNADDNEEEDGGGGKPRARFEQTPKQPNWSNRLMHQAMGVPTEDSPTYTVLSKVSTAAPSTQGSIDTIATEKRHALRGKQNAMQLESVAHGDKSPELGGGEGGMSGGGKMASGGGGQDDDFDGPMDPPEEMSQGSSQGGEKRGVDPEERDDVLEPEDEGEDVSAKASGKSAATSTPESLEDNLEEVANSNYNDDFDNDDNEGEGRMQFATQEEDADFGGGNDGGFDDDFDNINKDDDDDDAVSAQASQKSGATSKSDKSAVAKQSPTPEDEEEENEEEEPPKKKKAEKDAKKQSPITPTSVLRTSKKSKKKKQTTNRVNFSTPTGTSQGIPTGNRDYEIVPVSDYKGSHPPGEEPHTPGGSALRRSRRAKFKPLAYWKNEKFLYGPNDERDGLGDAMGDMPVVVAVQHALPTPHKEVKPKEPEKKKKKDKKRKRKGGDDSDSDDESDEEAKDLKIPYDDKALRKKYRIKNGESGSVWSETLETATDIKIVSRIDNRTFSKLPLSATRKERESKVVAYASQAFR